MSSRATSVRAGGRREADQAAADRAVLATMYTGLAATVAATVAPAATTYLVYLSIVGVLGVAAWSWTIHAVKADRRWARGVATAMFAVGTSVALTDLLIKDTSGDTGLPPLLGWIGTLPCLPGLIVVAMLWRKR